MPITNNRTCVTPVIDYDWLTASLKKRYRIGLSLPGGELAIGVINGIRAEDGSGKCWIVTLLTDNGEKEVFTRST